jgi:hypothetical protein
VTAAPATELDDRHAYAGFVHHNLALHDPPGALAARRAGTTPYPAALRGTIVRRFAWEAGFAVETAAAAAARGDVFHVRGCLFRSVACFVHSAPPGFAAEVDGVLGGLSSDPTALRAALERMAALTAAVRPR